MTEKLIFSIAKISYAFYSKTLNIKKTHMIVRWDSGIKEQIALSFFFYKLYILHINYGNKI